VNRNCAGGTGALPQTPNEDPQRAQEGSGALRPLSLCGPLVTSERVL